MNDALPAATVFVRGKNYSGNCLAPAPGTAGTVTCNVGTLNSGAAGTITSYCGACAGRPAPAEHGQGPLGRKTRCWQQFGYCCHPGVRYETLSQSKKCKRAPTRAG